MKQLSEKLLNVWLEMSMDISNRRIVEGISFNEAKVCNILFRHQQSGAKSYLTATDLCRETKMLKSAMNATLKALEEKKIIEKQRSDQDKRQFYIVLMMENMEIYAEEHQRILEIVEKVIERVGTKKVKQVLPVLEEITAAADELFEK